MSYLKYIIGSCILPVFAACTTDDASSTEGQIGALKLTSSVENFIGDTSTRVNDAGTVFEEGDLIRIKVICPYVTSTEFGETTWSNSYDGFWLQSWDGSAWTSVASGRGFDVDGDYKASTAPSLTNQYLVQQTPYVFTASTWTEEKSFVTTDNGSHVLQYSNVFHADQSHLENYKASDVLWAQTIMQTGTDEVHLTFQHVMSALNITIDSSIRLSDDAVVTLVGMPDIDQAEIIVGDKYAAYSKVNSTCGYQSTNKTSSDDENGKVLGIGVINGSSASCKAFTDIEQTATYKAYKGNGVYKFILPPCTLTNEAVIWIRDGEKRWSVPLSMKTFEQGKMYNITLNPPTSSTDESGDAGSDSSSSKEETE